MTAELVDDVVRVTATRVRFAHLVIPPVTLILAVLFWGAVPVAALLVPLGLLNLLAIRGLLLGRAFFRVKDEPDKAALFARHFSVGIILYGAAFGLTGWLLSVPSDPTLQLPLILVVAVGTAGGLTTQVAYPRAMHVYQVLAISPLIVRLLLSGSKASMSMAGLLAIFGIGVAIVGRAGTMAFREMMQLKLEKSKLADALRVAHDEVAASNKVLDQRVIQVTERLAQANQLASLGQLAAGVSHEINNPLSWILANTSFVRDRLEGVILSAEAKDALISAVDDITAGGKRISAIVKDMSALSRNEAREDAIDVHVLLGRCISVTGRRMADAAALNTAFEDGLPAIRGNAARLSQMFLNLLINAAESIPPERRPGAVEIRTSRADGRVLIEVTDNGCGVTVKPIDRVFDPFYTTKRSGEGSGLGLAISRNIAEEHGGTISAASSPAGTTVTVALPLEEVAAALDRTG